MIYFAQIGHDGPIKIGDTKNVEKRLRHLQVSMPWQLRLLRVIENCDASQIYYRFNSCRMRGEWFYPTKDLLAFINEPAELARPTPLGWKDGRRRFGSHLIFVRHIIDYCTQENDRFDWRGWRVAE